ncbi:unnamed protein product [Urochloa decumbens]|uniref:RING-type E3 ubiquitin transferase n=1 Tax=Urochloa decumbens TaxID=240449 RepID=A0ABC8ZZ67_9POAL
MSNLYTRRLSPISGEAGSDDDDGDGYGVFGGVAADAWSLVVASCVLAASVVIWEACAFAAMAAALAAGAAWCLSFVVAAGWSASRAGTEDPTAPLGGGACGLAARVDIRALPPASPYNERRDGPAAGGATCYSVCLEEVRGGEMVRSLPECRHVFHVGCIDAWLQWHVTCPLCRSDLSPRRRDTMAAVVAGLQQDASPSSR